MSFADLPVDILERLCRFMTADDVCRLAAVARHTCVAVQAAELHFPYEQARLAGRRQAALTFALQHADRVVRLGSLPAVEITPALFSLESLGQPVSVESLGQLAAFRRLAELKLDFHVSTDVISLLPRSLRRLFLRLGDWKAMRVDLPVALASDFLAFPPALEDLTLTLGPCPQKYPGIFALDATFSAALGRLQRLSIGCRDGASPNLRLPRLEGLHLLDGMAWESALAHLDAAALPRLKHTASLRGLELDACKKDCDLRCLPSLRRLAIRREVVQPDSDQRVYRLPAGLQDLAVFGKDIMYLGASSCCKDLLIVADHRIHLEFVGQNGRMIAACQPRVKWLHPDEVEAWIFKSLSCFFKYLKWWQSGTVTA